jgi:seryl-tRNA synthetase
MLGIKFIRENPDLVKKDLKKRQETEMIAWVDDLLLKDEEYRKSLQSSQSLRAKRNTITDEINKLKKEGKDASGKIQEAKNIPAKIKEIEENQKKLKEKIDYYLMRIPNILHDSVPVGKDDTENVVLREVGEKKQFNFNLKSHGEMIEHLNGGDFNRAAKIAGTGFYYLKGKVALLDLALQHYAIDLLIKREYTLVEPPFLMNRQAYEGVTDLDSFENVMYKIDNEDLYLIATSEHPMGAMFMNEVIKDSELPIKFCGLSACFRKEIGSHGIDTRGTFRVHQFNKIEQFIFCDPKDSWKFHEELQKNSEDLYKGLKIPYRVVNVCTGDIGSIAAKKYDLEAWSPRENKYFEVGSNSNCTAYQATRLNIRMEKNGERFYPHTLNNTAIAISRALRAILENYQNEDGSLTVPDVLVPYMNGLKKIQPE